MTVFEDAQILTIGDTIIESRSLLPLHVLVRIVFKTLKWGNLKTNLKDNVAFCVTTLLLSKAMETSFVKFTCLFHVCVQNEEQGHDKKSNRL